MQFGEGIRLALYQIRTEKLKSFFSLLGVIVGVMFLIVVVSVVEGIDRYIREDFSSVVFGVNTVIVRRVPDGPNSNGVTRRERARRPRLSYEDWRAVQEHITVPARVGRRAIQAAKSWPTTAEAWKTSGSPPFRPKSSASGTTGSRMDVRSPRGRPSAGLQS